MEFHEVNFDTIRKAIPGGCWYMASVASFGRFKAQLKYRIASTSKKASSDLYAVLSVAYSV
uniref:Uncharacterized protein n=1 Tax=Wuchereria bancrofti TaxID=6293 RepID=A0AAF5Q0D2_WUCBA